VQETDGGGADAVGAAWDGAVSLRWGGKGRWGRSGREIETRRGNRALPVMTTTLSLSEEKVASSGLKRFDIIADEHGDDSVRGRARAEGQLKIDEMV
jgi:hypothetical protein